jgi:hypothetical protein
LGWTVGHNVQIEYRSTAGEADLIRKYAAELIALAPDVILTAGGSHVMARAFFQFSGQCTISNVQVPTPDTGIIRLSLRGP